MSAYREFVDPQELLRQFTKGYVLYQAPLDARPYTVKVKRFSVNLDKPEQSTLTFWTSEAGTLTVKIMEHMGRFRVREDS